MVDKVYTVKEAAELLKVNPQTVYRIIDRGELKAARVGRAIRILEEDIEKYLEQQKEEESG